MDKERVALLITSIRKDLTAPGDPKTFNFFDVFELLELVARNSIQDPTSVVSCRPIEPPVTLHEEEFDKRCTAVMDSLDREKIDDAIVDEGFRYD